MRIAVDAAGGEYAPHEIVKGAIKASQEYEVELVLVGRKDILHVHAGRHLRKEDISIVEASQIIECRESPMKAVQSKPDSSIVVGINLVRDGKASAFISAGNTGAVVCATLLNLGKAEGVERPALGCILDISSSPTFLVDAGANVDCRPSHLVEFARLGSTYFEEVLGISSPRVSLLNNGEEPTKGNRLIRESYKLLKETDLNFVGNVEGQDVPKGKADIIVTDGFTGNIVIKTIEGLSDTLQSSVRQAGITLSSALLRDIGLGSWAKRIDYREYGGACLLGINGTVIISHGRSQSRAIKNAIRLAKQTVAREFSQTAKEDSNE
ncbi:phosphate acyltransferase PlsX [Chloroflexota bacterium]